jgi:hypothetical protein
VLNLKRNKRIANAGTTSFLSTPRLISQLGLSSLVHLTSLDLHANVGITDEGLKPLLHLTTLDLGFHKV